MHQTMSSQTISAAAVMVAKYVPAQVIFPHRIWDGPRGSSNPARKPLGKDTVVVRDGDMDTEEETFMGDLRSRRPKKAPSRKRSHSDGDKDAKPLWLSPGVGYHVLSLMNLRMEVSQLIDQHCHFLPI